MQITPFIEFEKIPLKIDHCKEEQFVNLSDTSRFDKKNMTDFICADVSSLEFLGTTSDDLTKYFHFEILRCEEELLHKIPGYEVASCASQ